MIIAVMSDSHDNIWNLRKALPIIKEKNAGMIIHCGDFVAPFMLKELNEADIPVHGVLGNNDGDQYLLPKLSDFLLDLRRSLAHKGFAKILDISAGMPAVFANPYASRSGHISSQKIAQLRF
jgi:uncharacterized protein